MPDQKQITIVVALIVNEAGEILLARRNQPDFPDVHNKWEFPGGGLEFGEEPEEALLREIKEETGLDVKIVRILPKAYTNTWKKTESADQIIILSYECKQVGGTLRSEDEEIGELKYFKPADIDYANCLPKTKEIINLLKL